VCGANYRCEEVEICARPRHVIGLAASRHPVKEALAACNAGGACPGGGTCEALRVCVLSSPTPATGVPAQPKGGCAGCVVATGEVPPGAVAGVVLALASAARRRRRR
jgi:MYXO-CTERM domain-containing protein